MDSRDVNFLVDEEFNITGVIEWELSTVVPKASAFQSPLFMYDFIELYVEGISAPCVEEERFGKVLREKGKMNLWSWLFRRGFFSLDLCVDTDTCFKEQVEQLFAAWWKGVNGVEEFDREMWRKDALKKYGVAQLIKIDSNV